VLVQCLGAGAWNDFVVFGSDNEGRRGYSFRVLRRFELVQQQPADWKVWKLLRSQLLQAVVWSDEDKPSDGPQTCQVNCYATAQASAYHYDVLMLSAHLVKQ